MVILRFSVMLTYHFIGFWKQETSLSKEKKYTLYAGFKNWVWWLRDLDAIPQFLQYQSRVNWGCYSATSVVRSQRRLLNLAARSLCLTSRKPPDIRTTAVALGGVVESMVSWKMLQDLHVHIHIWPLCNAGCCTMGPKIISEVASFESKKKQA